MALKKLEVELEPVITKLSDFLNDLGFFLGFHNYSYYLAA